MHPVQIGGERHAAGCRAYHSLIHGQPLSTPPPTTTHTPLGKMAFAVSRKAALNVQAKKGGKGTTAKVSGLCCVARPRMHFGGRPKLAPLWPDVGAG